MQLRARDNERSTPFYPSSPLLSFDHWPIFFFLAVLLRHREMPGTKQSRAFDAIEPRTEGEEEGGEGRTLLKCQINRPERAKARVCT